MLQYDVLTPRIDLDLSVVGEPTEDSYKNQATRTDSEGYSKLYASHAGISCSDLVRKPNLRHVWVRRATKESGSSRPLDPDWTKMNDVASLGRRIIHFTLRAIQGAWDCVPERDEIALGSIHYVLVVQHVRSVAQGGIHDQPCSRKVPSPIPKAVISTSSKIFLAFMLESHIRTVNVRLRRCDALDEIEQDSVVEIGVEFFVSRSDIGFRCHPYDGDAQLAIGAWLSHFVAS